MKKLITKFWGVGLVVVILSSLFVSAVPVAAAEPLRWEAKVDAPSGIFSLLAPGTDVVDMAIAPGGMTMYAAVTTTLYQSTSGGTMWSNIGPIALGVANANNRLPAGITTVDYIAMAPDDANLVLVANATGNVSISTNGGASFSDLGNVVAGITVTGLEVSGLATGNARYIAVTGSVGGAAVLYYRNLAGFGGWTNAVATFVAGATNPVGRTSITAFQFSPSFPSDFMAVATSIDANDISLHVISFNSNAWDGTVAAGYPVTVVTGVGALTVAKGAIALDPTYMGGDESTRIAFIAASATDAGAAGAQVGRIWRAIDVSIAAISNPVGALAAGGINSLTFDGTNLAAGAFASNKVYRSADPLAASPTVLASRGMKDIGIDSIAPAVANDQVIVEFVGETLFGAKQGIASAISKSTDFGLTWNDFTLLDSALTQVSDILIGATGDPWYLAANDNVTASIYRMSAFSVTRILTVAATAPVAGVFQPDFIVRGIDADPLVVYAADKTNTTIYYTADGGLARWQTRLNVPAVIADLAVESSTVIYFGSGLNVYKSSNSGFTWALPVNTRIGGAVFSLASVGENKLVVGSTTGSVNYSTDGGATWVPTFGTAASGGGGAAIVTASGLDAGEYLYATSSGAAPAGKKEIYRSLIGPTNPVGEFQAMNAPAAVTTEITTGLVYKDGVLYAISTTGANTYLDSTSLPKIGGSHSAFFWRTEFAAAAFNANMSPNSLKVAKNAAGSIVLYTVNAAGLFGPAVMYFEDSVALVGPTLTGPADGTLVQILSQLGGTAQPVALSWNKLTTSTAALTYQIQIGLNSGFTALAPTQPANVVSGAPSVTTVYAAAVPGNTYYWRVRLSAPFTSAWSETRSFTVQPMAAAVPAISSPGNGAVILSQSPAFSWGPVSGATKYQFELSTNPAFATTVYTDQPASAGAMLPVTITLEQGRTYFWRVKAIAPVEGDWSTVANFVVAEEAAPAPPPVVIEQVPAPIIQIPAPPPATEIVIPPPPADEVIAPAYIWAIIIIGAVLVIAVIVLIVRTRRTV